MTKEEFETKWEDANYYSKEGDSCRISGVSSDAISHYTIAIELIIEIVEYLKLSPKYDKSDTYIVNIQSKLNKNYAFRGESYLNSKQYDNALKDFWSSDFDRLPSGYINLIKSFILVHAKGGDENYLEFCRKHNTLKHFL